MIFCKGAPNSPAAAMRSATSASPNSFLRRRRPRAYMSLVSKVSSPHGSRRRLNLYGHFEDNPTGKIKRITAGYLAPHPFVRINRLLLGNPLRDFGRRLEERDEAAIRRSRWPDPAGIGRTSGPCRRGLSRTADQDHRAV